MNVYIAKIIKDLLSDLPYFDKPAGLVQTITKEESTDTKVVAKKFPIEVNVAEETTSMALYPNDAIKGMFFLEDGGLVSDGNNDWTSNLTLVCWFCPKKIASNPEAVAAHALADIAEKFKSYHNSGPVSKLKINIISAPVRDAKIFGQYTFDEKQTQYLMPPFDFFALKLKCSYRLNPNCLTPLIPAEPC